MKHTWTTDVRSYELDMHRHVNNATYLNYLEGGRMDFLNSIGFDYDEFFKRGYSLYVSRIEIAYKAPAFLNDRIDVITEAVKRKRLSGVFRQTVMRGQTVLADAYVTWACVNRDGRPVPLPEDFCFPEFEAPEKDLPV